MRAIRLTSAAVALTLFAPAAAEARIKPIPKRTAATEVARSIATDPRQVRRAFFPVVPPRGNPAGVSTTRLAGFPRNGRSFGMLSSGNVLFADDRNRSRNRGAANFGPLIRGARDVTILRIDLRAPANANCLTFRFRFLSEEYPEFVDDIFNDAFIAELDDSDWDASRSDPNNPDISAPRNFAVDSAGRPIRVNAVGDTSFTRRAARGTTYDGATRLLRASTPFRGRTPTLYLSIFDQGDRDYDSTVFLDKLQLTRNGSCSSGVVID
ncbi:MAG TPA: choice-of-anchor L domain-containing protein [Thermoleophilaceae bacterium]|nr:choice-of-anchor L domain-containing protein [Thermoleophilaceae bacterium]